MMVMMQPLNQIIHETCNWPFNLYQNQLLVKPRLQNYQENYQLLAGSKLASLTSFYIRIYGYEQTQNKEISFTWLAVKRTWSSGFDPMLYHTVVVFQYLCDVDIVFLGKETQQ